MFSKVALIAFVVSSVAVNGAVIPIISSSSTSVAPSSRSTDSTHSSSYHSSLHHTPYPSHTPHPSHTSHRSHSPHSSHTPHRSHSPHSSHTPHRSHSPHSSHTPSHSSHSSHALHSSSTHTPRPSSLSRREPILFDDLPHHSHPTAFPDHFPILPREPGADDTDENHSPGSYYGNHNLTHHDHMNGTHTLHHPNGTTHHDLNGTHHAPNGTVAGKDEVGKREPLYRRPGLKDTPSSIPVRASPVPKFIKGVPKNIPRGENDVTEPFADDAADEIYVAKREPLVLPPGN